MKAVDFIVNFELDYFPNNNRTSTVIINLTNEFEMMAELGLDSEIIGNFSLSVTNINLNFYRGQHIRVRHLILVEVH